MRAREPELPEGRLGSGTKRGGAHSCPTKDRQVLGSNLQEQILEGSHVDLDALFIALLFITREWTCYGIEI